MSTSVTGMKQNSYYRLLGMRRAMLGLKYASHLRKITPASFM